MGTLLVVSACGSSTSEESSSSADAGTGRTDTELVVGRVSPVATWNGDMCGNAGIQVNPMVYDTLLRMKEPDGQGVVPGLAESYSYDPATSTYTFKIRSTAKFSDGTPLTADDVVFSVNTWKAGPGSGSYYETVKEAVAVDDSTVTIAMTQPDNFLPPLLTWCTSPIYPKDFGGMSTDEYFKQPIAAGPFAVESFSDLGGDSEEIILVRNEHYWDADRPRAKGITLRTISDSNLRTLAFQSGDLDILEGIDSAQMLQIDPSLVVTTPPQRAQSLILNTRSGPLSDVNVRRAISLAIGREDIGQALEGQAVAAVGTVPINVPGTTPPTKPYKYDVAAAKELIATTSAADGLTLNFTYNAASPMEETFGQMLQEQLGQIGITLTMEGTDVHTLRANMSDGKFDLGIGSTSAISPHIFDPLSVYIATIYPQAGMPTDVINEQFLAGTAAEDQEAITAAAKKFGDVMEQDAAVLTLVNSSSNYAVQEDVTGFAALPYDIWYSEPVATS
ncbi:ABC transporter substrate-binding protein [Mycolicibacterium baixiangningiae]|uniref:ABC transporter substrate-binding protein n=1 Tax=Mycolicibacterium baixiangningiae TaxID=2761578 RepID=UPI0018D0B68B|nr:ABC transporter substrate-binding protein [Mycolicibacterium baixiangningiae]